MLSELLRILKGSLKAHTRFLVLGRNLIRRYLSQRELLESKEFAKTLIKKQQDVIENATLLISSIFVQHSLLIRQKNALFLDSALCKFESITTELCVVYFASIFIKSLSN